MQRKDKEISDITTVEKILHEAPVLRIAMAGEEPYIVPVNFAYHGGTIYVHSSRRGKKIDMLYGNGRVCFQTDIRAEVVPGEAPCSWAMKYLSVIGTGNAVITDDPAEKEKALALIMAKYSGTGEWHFGEKELSTVLVIKIAVDSLTGKQSNIALP